MGGAAYAAGVHGRLRACRIGIAGASLEAFRLDSVHGIAAFAAGRGLHGLLALLPMVVGVSVGLAIVRPRRLLTLVPTGILSLAVVGLAVLVAVPASTPPVLGADGQPVPGSIAELTTVELGGQDQAFDPRRGPGQAGAALPVGWPRPERPCLRPGAARAARAALRGRGLGPAWQRQVVRRLDPTSTYTLDALVGDTIELTEYLRDRFAEEKIYLLGESWGSTLGVLAVPERPDLFHAYIGSGQMVSQRETDRIIWRDLLAYADRTANGELYDQILTLGEPPYRDTPWANSLVMGYYPLLETPYTPPAAYADAATPPASASSDSSASEYASSRTRTSSAAWSTCSRSCIRSSSRSTSGPTSLPSRCRSTCWTARTSCAEARAGPRVVRAVGGAAQGADHLRGCRSRGRIRGGRCVPAADGRRDRASNLPNSWSRPMTGRRDPH